MEREALDVLARRDPARPLYLVVSFPHPHDPLDPPEPYESMYDPADSVLPSDGFEVNDGLPWAFRQPLTVKTGPFGPSRPRSERHLRELQALVRGLVRQIDDSIGRLLAAIDPGRTVVGFTSDHGDYGGHRGLLRKVPWIPFEDLWRVPLVVAAPDMVGGRRQAGMVQNLDWVATALDYAGVPYDPDAFEARSLRPALTDPDWLPDPDRHLIGGVADGWPTIRLGNLKLITRSHFTIPGRALFDLDADPGEQVDLATQPAWAAEADDLEDRLRRSIWVPAPDLPGGSHQVVEGRSTSTDLSGDSVAAHRVDGRHEARETDSADGLLAKLPGCRGEPEGAATHEHVSIVLLGTERAAVAAPFVDRRPRRSGPSPCCRARSSSRGFPSSRRSRRAGPPGRSRRDRAW